MKYTSVEFINFHGSLTPVNYIKSDGFCTCCHCHAYEWTDFCVRFMGKIYCYDCFLKIKKGDIL